MDIQWICFRLAFPREALLTARVRGNGKGREKEKEREREEER